MKGWLVVVLRNPIARLRWAGYFEGTTLILLLGVAVPLKRIWDMPEWTSLMGPIHGFAFMLYLVLLADTAAGAGWNWRDVGRTFVVCFVPFGTFFNDAFLRRKEQSPT